MNTERSGIVVLISGAGSNLQALIDAIANHKVAGKITAVISNKAGVLGLKRAEKAGISAHVLSHREFSEREAYDAALLELIEYYQPKLVVLAGFMRILSANFVEHFQGRLLNVHPSLLPKYKGLNTHQRAIDAGDQVHGVSVHFVTPALDGGPVIAQSCCEILVDDNAEALARRIQDLEHVLYPQVIDWFMKNLLQWKSGEVWLHGERLVAPKKI